jgi:hypothetical protein
LIPYIVGLVIAVVAWLIVTISLSEDAFRYRDKEDIKNARLAWLSFFLLPLYPAAVIVGLVLGPIIVFRRLGRISKEEE